MPRERTDAQPIAVTKTSAVFTQSLTSDSVDEPDGTVTMTVIVHDTATPGGASDYIIGEPSSVTVTVRDDDPTVVSLARTGTGAVTEGDKVEFTVTLGRALVAGEIIDVPPCSCVLSPRPAPSIRSRCPCSPAASGTA